MKKLIKSLTALSLFLMLSSNSEVSAQSTDQIKKIVLNLPSNNPGLSPSQIISKNQGSYMSQEEADVLTKKIMKDFSDEWYHNCGVTLFFLKDNVPYERRLLLCRTCLGHNAGRPPFWFQGSDWEIAKAGVGYGTKHLKGIFVFK